MGAVAGTGTGRRISGFTRCNPEKLVARRVLLVLEEYQKGRWHLPFAKIALRFATDGYECNDETFLEAIDALQRDVHEDLFGRQSALTT
jgi:hypothetical protein